MRLRYKAEPESIGVMAAALAHFGATFLVSDDRAGSGYFIFEIDLDSNAGTNFLQNALSDATQTTPGNWELLDW